MNLCQTSLCLRLSFPICMSVASYERNFFEMKINKRYSLINRGWKLTNVLNLNMNIEYEYAKIIFDKFSEVNFRKRN